MESSQAPPMSFLLLFDGPAHEQRISMVVPPTTTRWFLQGQEMGSDKPMEWWSMEPPPEDDSVQITEYRLDPTIEPGRDEAGDTVLHYTCDDTKWLAPEGSGIDEAMAGLEKAGFDTEAIRQQVTELSPDDQEIPRAFFSPADIRSILTTGGEWLSISSGGRMAEIVLEPDPTSPMKMGLGAMLMVPESGMPGEENTFTLVSPGSIAAIKMAESSIVSDDELQRDPEINSLRITRARFDSPDEEATEAIAEAEAVTVVEPDGSLTEGKRREQYVE